ncbi:hypothetical protein OG618_37385 (plasmid) [Kitasatospora sp. NBC_01246]|uniref:hypothetical protein n=1 Tax=Kitasatospora sp. NBC_01246 TaxID=2903570 RepID=UPI002E344792|nr:hypothetical protein [Kitasatospora sp. NBC_01246]
MTKAQQPTTEPARLLNELDTPAHLAQSRSSALGPGAGSGTGRLGSAPINVQVLQHIANCDGAVAKFINDARAAADSKPVPLPAGRSAVYREAARAAAVLGADWEQHLEAMTWRATVESELLLGDATRIRQQPCPDCSTVGLVWVRAIRRISCVNRHCAATTPDGSHRIWTVAQLSVVRVGLQPLKATG